MKKIFVFTNNSSGLYDFRKELLSSLVNMGMDVSAYTPFDLEVDALKTLGIDLKEISLDRRGINPAKDFRLFLTYRRILKKEKPDMVITYTIKPNVYGGFACRLSGIPYAINITGLGTTFQQDGLLKKLVVFLYKLSCKKAKTVFFENEENLQIFLKHKIVTEKQSVCLNGAGVNLDYFSAQEYPESDTTRFLFVGRVMEEKGVNELFAAMKRLRIERKAVELIMLGEIEEDYEEIIKHYELEGWLKFYGFQEDVRPFIEKAHCFVLPSWHEGMANTNLECAASGRPVITSNIHGCLEAVVDGKSGFLCEKQNAESLYEAMNKFMDLSYEERRQMGMTGRKHMEEVFDKRKVVEETMKALFE